MARRRSPTCRISTFGDTSGHSASEPMTNSRTSSGPRSVRTVVDEPACSSVADRTTVVAPPTTTEWTPGLSTRATTSLPSHRNTCSTVASSIGLAEKTTVSPVAAATARTCRSAGVTGSPSTSSRRAPSRSAVVTSRPSPSRVGTPGTSSTHDVVVVVRQHRGLAAGRVFARIDSQDHRPLLIA